MVGVLILMWAIRVLSLYIRVATRRYASVWLSTRYNSDFRWQALQFRRYRWCPTRAAGKPTLVRPLHRFFFRFLLRLFRSLLASRGQLEQRRLCYSGERPDLSQELHRGFWHTNLPVVRQSRFPPEAASVINHSEARHRRLSVGLHPEFDLFILIAVVTPRVI